MRNKEPIWKPRPDDPPFDYDWKYIHSKRLTQTLGNIKNRCSNPKASKFKYYGGKGIRCFLTYGDLVKIYERDGARKMKRPSIDRIDSNGHYIFENCRYIELSENCRRGR